MFNNLYLTILLITAISGISKGSASQHSVNKYILRYRMTYALLLIMLMVVVIFAFQFQEPIRHSTIMLLVSGIVAPYLIITGYNSETVLKFSSHENLKINPQAIKICPLLIIAISCLINGLLITNSPLTPKSSHESIPPTSLIYKSLAPFVYLIMVVSFAVIEEIIWRHYALPQLIQKLCLIIKPVSAYVVGILAVSLVFTAGHLDGVNEQSTKFFQIFTLSLVFSYLRLAYGTSYAVLLHILINISAWAFVLFIRQ